MSQGAYAQDYAYAGESLKYRANYERKYKPAGMSSNNWRGAKGNAWRHKALHNYHMQGSRGRGGRRCRTKRRRGTKRSTRRR